MCCHSVKPIRHFPGQWVRCQFDFKVHWALKPIQKLAAGGLDLSKMAELLRETVVHGPMYVVCGLDYLPGVENLEEVKCNIRHSQGAPDG
jgi:hypothetical protein